MIRFRLCGMGIGISVGFFAVLSLMLYMDQTGLLLPTLEATLFHELGHLVAMWSLGCRPRAIECRVGAITIRGRLEVSQRSEALICLAGPLMNLVLFQLEFLCYYWFGWPFLLKRSLVMLVMGLFHLLPIKGLDGGTVLFGCLTGRCSAKCVAVICNTVSLVALLSLILLGLLIFWQTGKNPTLVLLALYLLFAELVAKKKNKDCNLGQNAVQ